jgi:hypothetical protein
MTSLKLIVFKSLVWKKEDENIWKNAVLGFGYRIKPRPSHTEGMSATDEPLHIYLSFYCFL